MYNLAGIRYRLIACDLFYLLGGIGILMASRFWNSGRINKKYLYSGGFCTIVAVLSIAFHLMILCHPTVASCTGTLLESRRTSRSAPPWPVTWQYVFLNDDGKMVLELDKLSEKSIFPEGGLVVGTSYRICYEEKTDVIVWIEPVEQPSVTIGDSCAYAKQGQAFFGKPAPFFLAFILNPHGRNMVRLSDGRSEWQFICDAQNKPVPGTPNGTACVYRENLQGDGIAPVDSTGAYAVEYNDDAWG